MTTNTTMNEWTRTDAKGREACPECGRVVRRLIAGQTGTAHITLDAEGVHVREDPYEDFDFLCPYCEANLLTGTLHAAKAWLRRQLRKEARA